MFLTILVYTLVSALMLAPAGLALSMGTFRLLHPAVFFPLLLVYQSGIPVLTYVFTGSPMLRTCEQYRDDPLFYVSPLLIQLVACGIYFLGLRASLGSVVPDAADRADLDQSMPTIAENRSYVFTVGIVLLGLGSVMKILQFWTFGTVTDAMANPYEFIHSTYGYYWLHVLYTSTFVIPAVMFLTSPRQGLLGFCVALGASWLCLSKAAALRLVLPLLLFGIPATHRRWRWMIAVLVVVALLITPLFVAQYRGSQSEWFAGSAFESLLHREYSFEFFCLLAAANRFNEFPATEGSYVVSNLLELVPRAVWANKPLARNLELGMEWTPLDYNYQVFMAPHCFGILYLDCGVVGIFAGAGLLGLGLGAWYGRARDQARHEGNRYPLVLFLCNAVLAKGLVDGAISNYLMQLVFMVAMVACWRQLAWSRSLVKSKLQRSSRGLSREEGLQWS